MELIKNKYEPEILFKSAKENELSFNYNSAGELLILVWEQLKRKNLEATKNIVVSLTLTKKETANLRDFLANIGIV